MEHHSGYMIAEKFRERQRRNAGLSLRAFARQLRISPASLSEIMSGKRPLTLKMATHIADRLGLHPADRQRLIGSLDKNGTALVSEDQKKYQMLSGDIFSVISGWYYYVVLCLFDLTDFRVSPLTVSRKVGLTKTKARDVLERLVRVGLLRHRGRGYARTHTALTTSSDITSSALRTFHLQNLQRAEQALAEKSVMERDISSITIAGDEANLPKAKEEIKRFRRRMADLLEDSDNKNKVYTLSIQLFPASE